MSARHAGPVRFAVALVVLFTAVGTPLAHSLVTADHGCCADELGSGDEPSSEDDRRPGESERCADRGCCVVGCHVVTSFSVPRVATPLPVVQAALFLPPGAPTFVRPPGGIYRPPRA